MVTADHFLNVFLNTYAEKRAQHTDESWQALWLNTVKWSNFMIYDPESVVSIVARNSTPPLTRSPGEPFRLDAVFHKAGAQHWFPMLCAVEVENNPRDFDTEIQRLLSIRCPLKVGITYTLQSDASTPEGRRQLREKILTDLHARFEQIDQVVLEDSNTDYLFLVGDETAECDLSWYALKFSSGEHTKTDLHWVARPQNF
jgi:hypothetical protein